MAREFPIANGRLVTDLDANGFKILNAQGGGGGGTTDYNDLNNKPKIDGHEIRGNKTPADYGLATKDEVDELSRDAAQKRDKADNIAAASEFGEWSLTCPNAELNSALAKGGYRVYFYDDMWYVEDVPVPSTGDYGSVGNRVQGSHDDVLLIFDKFFIDRSTGIEYPVTATRSVLTKQGEPYVTPTGVKSIVDTKVVEKLPYRFEIPHTTEGDNFTLTVAPRTVALYYADDTPFMVNVGESTESDVVRDCALVVDLSGGTPVPTITWPANFHPRTDAETDFACVAGVKNVYWISEYAPNEFVVAGWQETTGGNA